MRSSSSSQAPTVQQVIRLVQQGKQKGIQRQRKLIELIVRLCSKSLLESVKLLGLLDRKVFWTTLVSVVSWRSFDHRRFHKFFTDMWRVLEGDLHIFDGRCISNMLYSFSKSRISHKQTIMQNLANRIDQSMNMDGQSVATSLNVLGSTLQNCRKRGSLLKRVTKLDLNDKCIDACLIYGYSLLEGSSMETKRRVFLKVESLHNIARVDTNLFYSLMGYVMIPSMSAAAITCLRKLLERRAELNCDSHPDDFDRLFRFSLWFEKQDVIPKELRPVNPSVIRLKAQTLYRPPATVSALQKQVSDCLDLLHPGQWRSEVKCHKTLYSLDIVRGNTVIEVDGPSHFEWGVRTNFATSIKREILKMHGWNVISVPHFEWSLFQSQWEQIQYLIGLLGLTLYNK